MTDRKKKHQGWLGTPHITRLEAWSLAFGCAITWGIFVQPWTKLLPMAGALGSIIGILASAGIMLLIAWNYHVMMNRKLGPGGVYAYAKNSFGADHGFLCGWFIFLTYSAVVWCEATALPHVANYAFGDWMRLGASYNIGSYEVHLGYIVVSIASVAIAGAICCRKRLAMRTQTLLAILLASGIVAIFVAAVSTALGAEAHATGIPQWAQGDKPKILQLLGVVSMAPWLFMGFESVSNTMTDFRFDLKKVYGMLALAICTAAVAYLMIVFVPVLLPGDAFIPGNTKQESAFAAYRAIESAFGGSLGRIVLAPTLVAAIFTNLVGNMFAVTRLITVMARDNALPRWLGHLNEDKSPNYAVFAVVVISIFPAALGMSIINVIMDISIIGATIAYAYTSAAALKFSIAEHRRSTIITGVIGLALATTLGLCKVLPEIFTNSPNMATPSYLVLSIWCITGLAAFFWAFRSDKLKRFGRSAVVWTVSAAIIMLLSMMWARNAANDIVKRIAEDIADHHATVCNAPAPSRAGNSAAWRQYIDEELGNFTSAAKQGTAIMALATVFSCTLLFFIHSTLRKREIENEEEKARAKSYFFSTVSHDIRTPLNAILGFSEMLNDGLKTEAERAEAINAILVSGKTLLGLINDVLDLSKLEAGKMDIAPSPTGVAALIESVAAAFRATNAKRGIEIRTQTSNIPRSLMVDPQRIRQIIFNVVGNAVKFTESGSVTIRVAYQKKRKDGSGRTLGDLFIEIEDTGCGISTEDLAKIGSAYTQVGSRVSRNGGTGLGLAICHQLAKAMGGKLYIHSVPGQGTVVSLCVPRVEAAIEKAEETEPKADGKENTPKRGTNARSMKILVADDMPMNLLVAKAHLKHLGYTHVETAANGVEALSKLQDAAHAGERFDLLLTDMWMPEMDGDALARAVRADPAIASTRIVALTADVEQLSKQDESNFDALLLKPVTSDKLKATLGG